MVKCYANGELVYAPMLDGLELLELKATVSTEKAGTAEIKMPPGHPAYDAFVSHKTVVEIYRFDELVFRGRALGLPKDDFYGRRTVTCEGERCFLCDGVMPEYSYKDTAAADIFIAAINAYNTHASPEKRFRVGEITVYTLTTLENEKAEQVSETIDKLVDTCGGFITFSTASDGARLINWVAELNGYSSQAIEFGENLLDFSRSGENTELATAIFPYGAKVKKTGKYLTVSSVNGGQDYIQDDEAVALRGFIAKPVYWDDVTDAAVLMTKATQYLAASKLLVSSLELSAVDLSALDRSIDTFRIGAWVAVRSAPHGVNDAFLLYERSYDFLNPDKDKVVFGKEITTLTGSSAASAKNNQLMLQQAARSLKTDYTDAIAEAVNGSVDEGAVI